MATWNRIDFVNREPYKYYRLYIDAFIYRCQISTLEFYHKPFINEPAFNITGQRSEYIGGPLIAEKILCRKSTYTPNRSKNNTTLYV